MSATVTIKDLLCTYDRVMDKANGKKKRGDLTEKETDLFRLIARFTLIRIIIQCEICATACIRVSRGRSSLCMRRSSISPVSVSSHSMIQTRVPRRAFRLRRRNARLPETRGTMSRLGF
ncbi:hypothetical protein PUN28_015426 [Cardiocondyla obscurior]|uniref:Uncharacterized protein n=1 Tax=Cardiocondyla obscurior TaxID=286306 RepID=A0AAW2ET32_9HYME